MSLTEDLNVKETLLSTKGKSVDVIINPSCEKTVNYNDQSKKT